MKRFFTFLLISAILLGTLLPGNVFAQEGKILSGSIRDTDEGNSGAAYERLSNYVNMNAFRAFLDTNLKACKTEIDISGYRIPLTRADDLTHYIFKDIPTAFHVEEISWTYYENGYYIIDLVFKYNMTQSDYNSLLSGCHAKASAMVSDLTGLSQVDQALLLHDRLALLCEYDTTLQKPHVFDMAGPFLNGVAVCEGYAKAYSYLLDLLGIRNYYCVSTLINHGWNIVYIDGVKYHVDVTWDDPVYDVMGEVWHDNFLRSSQGMLETGHYNDLGYYDFDTTPSDTRYDNAYWRNSDAAFQLIDGALYYIDCYSYFEEEETYLVQVKNGNHTVLADVSADFVTSSGAYFGYQKLASDGQDLLYSTGDAVYRYCLKSGTVEKLWNPPMSSGHALFGFDYKDGYLNCVSFVSPEFLADTNRTYLSRKAYVPHSHSHAHTYTNACDPTCNTCGEERTVSHSYTNACDEACNTCGDTRTPPHSYTDATDRICNLCNYVRPVAAKGDVDGSGNFDMDDAIYLLFYYNFPAGYPVTQSVDFDGSGAFDMDDAIYLLFHYNFPDGYPLH